MKEQETVVKVTMAGSKILAVRAHKVETDLKEQTQSYIGLHKVLMQDLSEARERLAEYESPSQFARRTYIRTLFALIEGETFSRKQVALALYELGYKVFQPEEVALLREEQYYLTEQGRAKKQQLFLRTAANLRFSFETFAKACKTNYKLDSSGREWESFKNIVDCRNRITHPKRVSDLNIKDEELQHAISVADWYTKISSELVKVGVREILGGP